MKSFQLLYIPLLLSFFILSTTGCFKTCPVNTDCNLIPEVGPCKAAFPRYYYDNDARECKEFIWGGCQGLVPFEDLESCKICECNR